MSPGHQQLPNALRAPPSTSDAVVAFSLATLDARDALAPPTSLTALAPAAAAGRLLGCQVAAIVGELGRSSGPYTPGGTPIDVEVQP